MEEKTRGESLHCHEDEPDGGLTETLQHEDLNFQTDDVLDDKEESTEHKEESTQCKGESIECKEDCLQDEKEVVGEEKSDEHSDEKSLSDFEKNNCHEDSEAEERNSIYNMTNIQLMTTRPFPDSEDEVECTSISTIDDPKQKILWAAEKNEVDVVRQLLEEDSSLVNARDEDLYTPLHRACSNNHPEIIKLLLSSGADIGSRTEDEWCPLHCACRWDSVEAASLLLQNGANVNVTSKGGLSPLHLAAGNSSGRRTLELLLWHPHIDGNLKAENGDTAYDIACRTSNTLLRLFELLEESVNCF